MENKIKANIYKITNTIDNMIYIGSTKRSISIRFSQHKWDAADNSTKKISQHIRQLGKGNFKIQIIKSQFVNSRKEMWILEQTEIEKYDKSILLNTMAAYTSNPEKTRDIIKKRAVRRVFYHKHMKDDVWREKEKLRNRLRIKVKRMKLTIEKYKNQLNEMNTKINKLHDEYLKIISNI